MQRIGWILAILLALGWLASEIPLQNAASNDQPRVQTSWRRTVVGWEDAGQWTFYSVARRPAFHPFYLGMIQCAAVAWIAICCHLVKFMFTSNSTGLPANDKKNASPLEGKSNST